MQHHPRVDSRTASRALALALVLFVSACGGGGGGGGGSTPPPTTPPPTAPPPTTPPPTANRAPTAANDVLQVTNAGIASLNVLANDVDPDGDALTVSVTAQPFVGTAAVNANGTVAISGLPSGFRGVTRFAYQVRDPGGQTSSASAAVFVDTTPFRLAFVAADSATAPIDLYVTDFAASPVKVAALSTTAQRQVSYRTSRTGATVAYLRADAANVAGTEELYYVRTQPLGPPVRVTLPAGASLFRSGGPQFGVSPDGRWLVLVAGSGNAQTLHVLDVNAAATTPTAVSVADAPVVRRLQFSADSRFVYFFGAATAAGTERGAIWRMPLDRSSAPVRISAATTASSGIVVYRVLASGNVIAGRENVGAANQFVVIDPAQPGQERVVSHAPTGGAQVDATALTLSPDESRFTYSEFLSGVPATYLAPIAGPAPTTALIARSGATCNVPAAIAPDNATLLAVRTPSCGGSAATVRLFEVPLTGPYVETNVVEVPAPATLEPFFGYEGTRDRVVIERSVELNQEPGNQAHVVLRSQFGGTATTKLGAPDRLTPFRNYAAVNRGVVVFGERPGGQNVSFPPVLANTSAPDRTYALSSGIAVPIDGPGASLLETGP
jgi:Tol biopolymer transport system component